MPQRPPQFLQQVAKCDVKKLGALFKNLQDIINNRYMKMRCAFREFQMECSGSISLKEFNDFIRKKGWLQNASPEDIEALFAIVDDNHDGKIGYQEFCRWLKAPDRHENLMVAREDPYEGERGGMFYLHRTEWVKARIGQLCE